MAGYAIVPDIDAEELTGIDLAVWAALCRFAQWEREDGEPVKSRPGTCYPSIQGLINTTRFGKTAVCASLKKLESLGYIVRSRRQRGKKFATTEYTLVVIRHARSAHSEQSAARAGVVRGTDRGCSPDGQGLSATRTQTGIYNRTREQDPPCSPPSGGPASRTRNERRERRLRRAAQPPAAGRGGLSAPPAGRGAPPPATWEEAVRQYRERNGFDTGGGESYAETGLAQVS